GTHLSKNRCRKDMISPICDVVPLVNSLCHRAVTRRVGRAWVLGKTIALRIQASQEGRDSTRSCKPHSEGSIVSSKRARRAGRSRSSYCPEYPLWPSPSESKATP